MKRLYYNIVYAICVIAGFSSCSDFLVIEPQNEIIFDKFWNEKADVTAVIDAILVYRRKPSSSA